MAHRTVRSGYSQLVERLNRFPQGAPPSELLYRILEMLFSEKEAGLAADLPIRPFTAGQASRIWKMSPAQTQKKLDELAGRGILVDIEQDGQPVYVLPPPMAGFFEFSLMRTRGDIDQKVLSELFYEYLNVEEDFIRALFTDGETQLGRVFVHEPVLTRDNALHVLDYERATNVIESASHIGIGICYCRHKMEHMGKACDAAMDICMTFNSTAASLVKHEIARKVDKAEAMDILAEAWEDNLVQFGENVREKVSFICNCCACCCEAMLAAQRFGILNPVHTTNFIPEVTDYECTGCGKCVKVCPVYALELVASSDKERPNAQIVSLQEEICLGCGVCVRNCSYGALELISRPERVITPLNSAHRTVIMAIERGKLQELIFDNQVLFSHRALAAVLGVILKLPPIKQVLATDQIKSRYTEYLISR
ncbi:MAG: 4Fe-4S dicluster domain-containing protein, partial [bacterium]